MKIKLGINWTRSAIALALLCAVFSFTAMAQENSNKPLDAAAASALRQELIDGLPDLIDDEAQVTAITEKWEGRRDLAGKTREEILETLYLDTESIVTDAELRESIWKAWTADTETDEEAQVETRQKPAAPEVKTAEKPVTAPAPVNASDKPLSFTDCANPDNGLMGGRIRWYDREKGYGFIIAEDGKDIIIERRNNPHLRVKTGDRVVFFQCITLGPKPKRTAILVSQWEP